ncbi:MAG: hypothetical protein HY332_19290 [Chloroflexi bacterium]|nr:hypothetical protein [Chloroflexota bacterium]
MESAMEATERSGQARRRHWWEAPLRIIQLNLTVPDAARDGAAMARRVHEYGANALLINAGGIYAFYPTEVPYHRRAPGLAGDLLGDAIRYCHAKGLWVIVRYDLIGQHCDTYEAHPEWFYRSHDGCPMVDKGLYMTCPNGGWWQEQFFALWDELTARYDVDGLFFNAWGHKEATREGVYFGPCHCSRCTRLFHERYGRDLPRGRDTADPVYWLNQQFRRETLDDLGRRIYQYVKQKNPEVAVFAGAGHRALVTGQADCTEIELHCGSTAAPAGNRWRHAAGESCKQVSALGPGYASGINAVYCHVGPGRWRLSAAPPGWLGYTLAQTIANAGWPYCMMIGTIDTQPDRTALPMLREILQYARDHETDYRDLASVARIGLLWSQRTATAAPAWTDTTDRYVKHFRGWYDLLTRKHHLFDIVSDTQLEGEGSGFPGQRSAAALIKRYGVLIVPNAARLSAAACATLDRYAALGGKLIATGAPPVADGNNTTSAAGAPGDGEGLRSLGAHGVFGERERVSNGYFRMGGGVPDEVARRTSPPGPLSSGVERGNEGSGGTVLGTAAGTQCGLNGAALSQIDLLPVEGRLWYVALREGARRQLALIPPEDYGAPEQTYFTIETDHPGIVWYGYEQGVTAYLPWEPDRAWFETGSEALGVLLNTLVTTCAPPQVVRLEAPETVELTAHRQRATGRLLIHLVNGSGGTPPRWAEPTTLRDLTVRFAWNAAAPAQARAARAGETLALRPVEGGYELTVPTLGLFEMVAVQ